MSQLQVILNTSIGKVILIPYLPFLHSYSPNFQLRKKTREMKKQVFPYKGAAPEWKDLYLI
jgi:hypothetical protein